MVQRFHISEEGLVSKDENDTITITADILSKRSFLK